MGRRIPWERGIGRVTGVLEVDHEAVDEDRRLWWNVSASGWLWESEDPTNAMTIVLTGAPALWKFQVSKATGNRSITYRCMQRYLEDIQCEKTPRT